MTEDTLVDRPADSRARTRSSDVSDGGNSELSRPPNISAEGIDPDDATAIPHSIAQRAASKVSGKPLLNSPLELSERQEMIRIISNRLFVALFVLLVITMAGGYLTWSGHELSAGATNWMVILCGAIGGFISLQRRLKTFMQEDLLLLARSWVYVLLSPLVGGILALLLYFLFISGLLEGDLFPNFDTSRTLDADGNVIGAAINTDTSRTGMTILFQVQGVGYKDYAKLVFWCFLAGYSESFVTNIISHFESAADQPSNRQ